MYPSCIYVNTSIVIRALNPGEPGHFEAKRILEECCKECRCVYSSVLKYEMPSKDFSGLPRFLEKRGATYAEVDTSRMEAQAVQVVIGRRLTRKRIPDLLHIIAAKTLGCKYILARDRFLWRNAKYDGLEYVNWETHRGKCPCSRKNLSTSGQAET